MRLLTAYTVVRPVSILRDDSALSRSFSTCVTRVTIRTISSTQEAMSKFRPGRFDTVITDMGRDVDGPKVGVELTRQIRMIDTEVPIIIYCSRESVQRYGVEAMNAGANEVTWSEIRLREMLQLYP
jgi:DNA-binding NtrC family response regulator